MTDDVALTDAEWRERLTPEHYDVLRGKATARPFSGTYGHSTAPGTYHCGACGAQMFSSETKFESGTGWPSFTEPADRENVELHEDRSHGMVRTEVTCKRCGSHLGHVFPDGPQDAGGMRYCINSVALKLDPDS